MTRVAILSRRLAPGEPCADDAGGMSLALQARGHDVHLFADELSRAVPAARPVSDLSSFLADETALLLYHHSEAWQTGLELCREARCTRVLKYHREPVGACDEHGHHASANLGAPDHLRAVVQAGCDLYLASTDYHRQELLAAGVAPPAAKVLPPFHRVERLETVKADLPLLFACRDGRNTILSVGPLLPSKRHDVLLATFAAYHHGYNAASRLVIVGSADQAPRGHEAGLRKLAVRLGLKNAVVFAGAVSDEVLKAYYLAADAFLQTSQYEGFSVPLIEAMALKVPVVAVGSDAVPEVLGPEALLWEEPDVSLLAESIHTVVTEEETAAALGYRGWGRYKQFFSSARTSARFLSLLGEVL